MSEQRFDTGADAATSTDGDPGGGSGSGGSDRPAGGTGEVSSPPREERRAQDPGSMATEFGDRADEAPDTEIAHPTI